jgi:hypothetical protein
VPTPPPRIELLGRDHDRAGFICGREALDPYFQQQVTGRARRASPFVMVMKVLWQQAPLTAGPRDIQNAVEDDSQIGLARPPRGLTGGMCGSITAHSTQFFFGWPLSEF